MRLTTSKNANSVMKSLVPSTMNAAPARMVVASPRRITTCAPFTQMPVKSSPLMVCFSAASMSARMPSK